MVKDNNAQNDGIWGNYHDVITRAIAFYDLKKGECPKGVSLIHEKVSNKHYLSFRFNLNGKRVKKKTGEDFNEIGIMQSVIKSHKIADVLSLIAKGKFAISDFDDWYNREILNISEKVELLTYRQIFSLIESKYFAGKHRNTGRQRTKDITQPGGVSDVKTFNRQYGGFFKKFPDWDKIPSWQEIWTVWESCKQGSKDFSDMKTTVKAIVRYLPNCDDLMKKIDKIDCTQTKFKKKQFVGLDDFLIWWETAHENTKNIKSLSRLQKKQQWLWVCGMSVLYGLRPSEIAAAQNLTKSFTKDCETVYALTDEVRNPNALLVIGEFTYFGASTKTGLRVIAPIPDKALWDKLQIRNPRLPQYTPKPGSKPDTIAGGFEQSYRSQVISLGSPTTEQYAYRHLYNLLCKLHGLPQELRARLMGHTPAANMIYEKRFDFQADVQLAKSGKNQTALPYDTAIKRLQEIGLDTDTPDVQTILRVIYQID